MGYYSQVRLRMNLDHLSGIYKGGLRAWAVAGAMALVTLFAAPATAPAAECSIEAHGEAAYTRVKEKIREKLYKVQEFMFEPYETAEISIGPDCVFSLHGQFRARAKGNLVRRIYDAKLTPKRGAPRGMKVMEVRLSRG